MALTSVQKPAPSKKKSDRKKSPCEYPGRSRQGPGVARTVPLDGNLKQVEFSNFDIARSYVKPEHQQFVENGMQENQDALAGLGLRVLAIEGATSTTGSLEYNEKLSGRRANCVYEMLMERVPLLLPNTPLIQRAGEIPAQNRLKAEGLDPTKEVEASQDRKVTVLLGLPGPKPGPAPGPTPLPPDQAEMDCVFKQFDQHCFASTAYEKFGGHIACEALSPQMCAALEGSKWLLPKQTKKSVDECCALPSINPTPQSEELQQAVENCVVKEAHRVYHEAGHDIEPEEFRAKYRDWRDSRSAEQSGTDCSNIYEPK
ncbi:MAG: hypothetical protein R6X02_35535 [Enhygromyxa sp.]